MLNRVHRRGCINLKPVLTKIPRMKEYLQFQKAQFTKWKQLLSVHQFILFNNTV